jgi:sugar lactone lactonase YvrE
MKRIIISLAIIAATAFGLESASAAQPQLEIVAEWNSLPYMVKGSIQNSTALLQGVKVDSKGNMYVSTARWAQGIPATLSKLEKNGDVYVLVPFPSEEMNDVMNPKGLKAVLGFEIDRNDVMWILDQGHIAGAPSNPGDEKLILWDLKRNREIQRYIFSDADTNKTCSFLNDVVVDNDTGFAYIADSGIFCSPLDGGLIVYDSHTNKARRVLDRTKFTNNEPNFFFNISSERYDIRPVTESSPMLTGADGIALSGDKKTLYWTCLTGHTLWALDTKILRDSLRHPWHHHDFWHHFYVREKEIEEAVRLVTTLPSNTDGMTADRDNNIYMTALTLNGLMKLNAETGLVERFVFHREMSWNDTLAWGPDGSLYIVSNHLNVWVDGNMDFTPNKVPNFRIWRIPNVGTSYTAP